VDRLNLSSGTDRNEEEELDVVRVKPIMVRQAWTQSDQSVSCRTRRPCTPLGGDEVAEDETRAVVGNLEDWPDHFYRWEVERDQGEMMAGLMGAYGVRRLVIRN